MILLVPGVSGLLGTAFAATAKRHGHHVIGVWHESTVAPPVADRILSLDLGQPEAVRDALRATRPDAIVNCAAVSSPADCEKDPGRSERINVVLPQVLAEMAAELGARLVHVSSEQVFDGTRHQAYAAGDGPAPLNVYGHHKVESEQRVHAIAPSFAATVRPPLLVGNSSSGTRSLHEQLLAAWSAGHAPKMFTDEFRQPCSATNLASVLLELCERRDITRIVHWAGRDVLSRFDLAARIRDRFELSGDEAPLTPMTRAEVPAVARIRPQYLRLDISAATSVLRTPVESLDAALAILCVPPHLADWYERSSRQRRQSGHGPSG